MEKMFDAMMEVLQGGKFAVVESLEVPGRAASFLSTPEYLYGSPVGALLDKARGPQGLWSHQAEALRELGSGRNVVLSTGTASGKSLVFQSFALQKILTDANARVIVFYPLLALAADQRRSWEEMCTGVGLSGDIVGRIDGLVALQERDEILARSRIVLMTPDVCHAWLMARLAMPVARQFIGNLALMVMDEAHTLEGVLGSNFAYLVRRIVAARNYLSLEQSREHAIQFVAATATIRAPSEHLRDLTGADFVEITHENDGAPHYNRIVAHVASPPGEELGLANNVQRELVERGTVGSFLTFVDSRKGVESLAMATYNELKSLHADNRVAPYRSGFTLSERRKIEDKLRSSQLSGVVSTSALEAGIDFPNLTVGLNVGLPPSRKSYRQRLGRIGRTGPGAFVFLGPPTLFRQYGTSLKEYHETSIEPSYLYVENRFMQFAHARCLSSERQAIGAPLNLGTRRDWPQGFGDVYEGARPGADQPREFDEIARIGGDDPQRNYPLRSVGEANYEIKFNENSEKLGDITQAQGLRESYPGARYYHNMKSYEVTAWRTSPFQSYIQVKGTRPGFATRPRITTWVNTGIRSSDVLEGRLLRSELGFLAESEMRISERVEGFTDLRNNQYHPYSTLQQSNPNMKSRTRNVRTTGIVLCIHDNWFNKDGIKNLIADRIREVFTLNASVLPQDIGSAATNVVVRDSDGQAWRNGCIVIYDETHGSLRLTESLFVDFGIVLQRLLFSSNSQGDADVPSEMVKRIAAAYASFRPQTPFAEESPGQRPRGFEQAYTPRSVVLYREKGFMGIEVEIIRPTIMNGELMYQVKAPTPRPGEEPVRRWIPATALEPGADSDNWNLAWWNRETEEYEEEKLEDSNDA